MWTQTAIILLAFAVHSLHVHRTHLRDQERYDRIVELAVLLTATDKYHREAITDIDGRIATITGEMAADDPVTAEHIAAAVTGEPVEPGDLDPAITEDIAATAERLRKFAAEPGRHALRDQP